MLWGHRIGHLTGVLMMSAKKSKMGTLQNPNKMRGEVQRRIQTYNCKSKRDFHNSNRSSFHLNKRTRTRKHYIHIIYHIVYIFKTYIIDHGKIYIRNHARHLNKQ
ncbi:hypothetical protein VNO77_10951 [Canavalia gladiata]|uniref:Uncharacterized protein n=1 Tax=Canavalia gladiata TaxID=3824 RepID=A0AAN9MAZ1_CANGL